MLRVVIVEDEAPALRKLIRMVEDSKLATICGSASSFNQALPLLEKTDADLALLDIELGDGTAFELLQNLSIEPSFGIVFCTAYNQYAIQAFEVSAIDYLLKPVSPERLEQALQKAQPRQHLNPFTSRILVEHRKGCLIVPVAEVDWFEADRNYILIHSGANEYVIRSTMEALVKRLDPKRFLRINRSAIARIEAILRLDRTDSGDWIVVLQNGNTIITSKKPQLGLLL
ncbi:MAG: LytTR family DNA-binding domain-containing protein [Acidobacteria bacterium]|nr:LytTR family DNA-binding domain-containing protein [Acidobacteriota bacterium]